MESAAALGLRRRPLFLRPDTAPFAALYAALLAYYAADPSVALWQGRGEGEGEERAAERAALLLLLGAALLVVNALLALAPTWSLRAQRYMCFTAAGGVR